MVLFEIPDELTLLPGSASFNLDRLLPFKLPREFFCPLLPYLPEVPDLVSRVASGLTAS